MIARACLTILLRVDGSVNKATIKNLPLAFYAAQYWVGHAKLGNVSLHAREAIQRVFDPTEPYYSTWSWLRYNDERRESISETPPTLAAPLYCAAEEGLDDVAEWLITSRSQDPNGLHGLPTPLYYASGPGKLKVAQVLIKHGADTNSRCSNCWPPLHVASFNGLLGTSHLLIDNGADVNARYGDGLTPFIWPLWQGIWR